ncbi:hypothetical protein TDB9533_03740 [Thalassocella blandensis]|nr:hypothetical protein TDB9533_03740 [Thalassocella blandensis]
MKKTIIASLMITTFCSSLSSSLATAGAIDLKRQSQLGLSARHSERLRVDSTLQRSTRISTDSGRTMSRAVDIQQVAPGERLKTVTRTDAEGNSQTRSKSVLTELNAEGAARSVVHTGPEGETRSKDAMTELTGNGAVRNVVITNSEGENSTKNITTELSGNSAMRSVVNTSAEGETRSREAVTEVSQSGAVRNVVMTNAEGESLTKTIDTEISGNGATRSMTSTNADGETRSRESSVERTEDGALVNTTQTTLDGEVYQRSAVTSVDRQSNTVEKEMTVTNPNGEVSSKTVVRTYASNNTSAGQNDAPAAE